MKDKRKDQLSWFLGPKAEHSGKWSEMLNLIFNDYVHWRRNYFPEDPVFLGNVKKRQGEQWFDDFEANLNTILYKLKNHSPFYSPRYIAHMNSEVALPGVMGYFAAMLYNPNNVSEEAAPITVPLEIEVGKMIAKMLGYNPETSWTHICSGGTVANIEALWAARAAQFNPIIAMEYCKEKQYKFKINTPNSKNDEKTLITDFSHRDLISLNPDTSISILRELARFMINDLEMVPEKVITDINKHYEASDFNVNNNGFYKIANAMNIEPVIFATSTAHYSLKKAANLLGYGSNAVKSIQVNNKFRMNTDKLREEINSLKSNQYVAAVIGIAGTTETGAVDPIHDIMKIRNDYEKSENKSFWVHVDAAWGGYIRTIFCNKNSEYITTPKVHKSSNFFIRENGEKIEKHFDVKWNDPELHKAFNAFSQADSITIDPHKLQGCCILLIF